MTTPTADVCASLEAQTFPIHTEEALQTALAGVLGPLGFVREHVVSAGRLDFFREEDGTAVEVKIKGSKLDLLRQVGKYAECEEINTVIVVTAKPSLGNDLPETLDETPIHVVKLYRSIF